MRRSWRPSRSRCRPPRTWSSSAQATPGLLPRSGSPAPAARSRCSTGSARARARRRATAASPAAICVPAMPSSRSASARIAPSPSWPRRRPRARISTGSSPRSEQRAVLGTDFYHGGAVRMDIGGLHPAKFHAGLLRLALAAGAAVHGETAVQGIRSEGDGHEVATARGTIRAHDVIVGVNGYADASDRWLRRRLVPVRSRMIATAPLSANLMGELMPRRMMCSETRKLHYYYRPSPDGERILFGGRDGTIAGDPDWPTENL